MSKDQVLYRQAASRADLDGQTDVRWDVFVVEQDVPLILEIDARDFLPTTLQIVAALPSGKVIGSARLVAVTDEPAEFLVGRIAVRKEWRGHRVGAGLVLEAERLARATVQPDADVLLRLDAQVEAEGFYGRLGYLPTKREKFWDAGILHQEMTKTISASN